MNRRLLPLLPLLGALTFVGCDDDPILEEDHSAPAVVEISLGDVVVARAFAGSSTGFVGAQLDQETAVLTFTFLDDESALVVPGDDEYLEVIISDEGVATFEPTAPGGFEGRFRGRAIGETTAEIRFMHGSLGSGHADFVSHPVNIIIN
jgi:hypothetical protein